MFILLGCMITLAQCCFGLWHDGHAGVAASFLSISTLFTLFTAFRKYALRRVLSRARAKMKACYSENRPATSEQENIYRIFSTLDVHYRKCLSRLDEKLRAAERLCVIHNALIAIPFYIFSLYLNISDCIGPYLILPLLPTCIYVLYVVFCRYINAITINLWAVSRVIPVLYKQAEDKLGSAVLQECVSGFSNALEGDKTHAKSD